MTHLCSAACFEVVNILSKMLGPAEHMPLFGQSQAL